MFERRHARRRHLLYYLRVYEKKTGMLLGHVADITTEGLMLTSEQELPVGNVYLLVVELNEEISGKKKLNLTAKSVQSDHDPVSGYYNTGFQLIGLSPVDSTIIERLITDIGFRD